MADDDNRDPFSEPGDIERTVIRPSPARRSSGGGAGGARSAGPAPAAGRQQAPRPPQPAAFDDAPDPAPSRRSAGSGGSRGAPSAAPVGDIAADLAERSRHNPVIAAASPLLSLIARLRLGGTHRDPDALRDRVMEEFEAFNRRLKKTDLPEDQHRTAHYVLSATMDDIVLNTPWGSGSIWSREGMTLCFHGEAYGGKRFYSLLNRMSENPGRNARVLELIYLCLSLGFEGELRVLDRGRSEHRRKRDGLYRLLLDIRGEPPEELSPHWRGAETGHRPVASLIPVWVIASATAALLVLLFLAFSWWLNTKSDDLYGAFAGLPPSGAIVIEQVTEPPPPPPPPPPEVAEATQVERVSGFLEQEIEEGLVSVLEDARVITVRLMARGMFPSGSATVSERFHSVLNRVALALNDEPGKVIIQGHTDNVPIRTVRFPSNYDLSLARAQAVRDLIAADLDDPDRLSVEAKAATEPIADNSTPEGREANRRTDVLLVKQGS
jgi:type VI secretion system protein ImpK